MDAQRAGPVRKRSVASSRRLKASKENKVAFIADERLQVMHHSTTGRHAARRGSDHGSRCCAERLGFISRIDQRGCAAHQVALRRAQAVFVHEPVIQCACIDSHGAIKKHRNVRNIAAELEPGDV